MYDNWEVSPNFFCRKPPWKSVSTIKLWGYVLGIVRIRGLGSEVVKTTTQVSKVMKKEFNMLIFPICAYSLYIPKVFKRERFSCFETVKVCFEAMGRKYFRGRILQHLKRMDGLTWQRKIYDL